MLQLAQAASSAFHVVMLLIGLSGQPVGVGVTHASWPDKAACVAGIPGEVTRAQAAFDSSPNPQVKGHIAVADAVCMSDEEIKGAKNSGEESF